MQALPHHTLVTLDSLVTLSIPTTFGRGPRQRGEEDELLDGADNVFDIIDAYGTGGQMTIGGIIACSRVTHLNFDDADTDHLGDGRRRIADAGRLRWEP